MKFSAVVLIIPEEDENRAVGILKHAGATGLTILKGKGLRHNERKTFLGLGLERKESVLLCVVEKQLAMRILRSVKSEMKLDEPGGGWVVHLRDPDGRSVDVVAGIEPLPPLPVSGHAPLNTGAARPRVDELQRVRTGPSQVKRFGHAAIKTASLADTAAWYQRTLGLLTSDDVYLATPDEPLGRFLRCDRADQPADHHSLLVIETGEARLGHCAWEVADVDDLMAGHDHLLADDRQHYWGVGRHVLGGQVFDYWKDPLGFTVEHWTDADLLTSVVPAGARSLVEPINQWGPAPPADLDF